MRSILTFALLLAIHSTAAAQCDCDHMLDASVTVADGAMLGVMPGDRVCVMGDRDYLRIQHFTGTAADPITILNCGGPVFIHNTDRAYALVIEAQSEHVRVTGTGDPASQYGFRVSAPATTPYAAMGIWIQGRATDIEVDHAEVFETGFAGVMAKTDPQCEDLAAWPTFVQRNVHLHDLWVHDTGGEGFYIGSTQSMGYARTCGGTDITIPPHYLDGIEIDHVRIEDTGWDGIQIGFARTGCSFHDSSVHRVGLRHEMNQGQGLQLGTASACDVRRVDLRDGPAMGIFVLEAGETTLRDNVIARFAANGIYANPRMEPVATWTFVHNTIVGTGDVAIRAFGHGDGEAVNNFVVGAMNGISLPAGIVADHNVMAADVASAGLMGDDDFHLSGTSPARGAGRDLTAMGYALDLDGNGRAMPPAVGAYEYAGDALDAGPRMDGGPSDAGVVARDVGGSASVDVGNITFGDAGPPASSGGCGCRANTGSPTASWIVLTAIALGAMVRSRRRA
jgi:hypothetical protein